MKPSQLTFLYCGCMTFENFKSKSKPNATNLKLCWEEIESKY